MISSCALDHIVEQLQEIRGRCPELRFGQLLATIRLLAEDETGTSLWEVEDADFVAALDRFARDISCRDSNTAPSIKPVDSGKAG
ncbi:MAG: hypothetical protein ACKO23_01040 [Gemmataceae bacterium]